MEFPNIVGTEIKVRKILDYAMLPVRSEFSSVGLDLSAAETKVVWAKGMASIRTGLAIEIPFGHYALICGRSGLAAKNGIVAFNGTIDSGYRGEVLILLHNTTASPLEIKLGQRCAQMIILPDLRPRVSQVETLSDSGRGTSGFGSTGI